MSKSEQLKLLRQVAMLMAQKRVCNQPSVFEWMRICFFAHKRGFLYCGFDGGKIDLACIAYRTPAPSPKLGRKLPERESGDILYVCAVASKSDEPLKLFRLMKWYLRENPNVNQIVYHKRNTDEFIVNCIRRKHGKIVQSVS